MMVGKSGIISLNQLLALYPQAEEESNGCMGSSQKASSAHLLHSKIVQGLLPREWCTHSGRVIQGK